MLWRALGGAPPERDRLRVAGDDMVAGVLGAIGWVAVLAGVVLVVVGVADLGSFDNSTAVPTIVGGVVAAVQGLLLVGFGRMIVYLRAAAQFLADATDPDASVSGRE